ncbi:MAG TPA: branched-chain amino acid ABC transporter permease [Kofleriaceae bacterium]|nr:branched-chain amino acid ABC transporter permease [Kofleriaceae bacterium]
MTAPPRLVPRSAGVAFVAACAIVAVLPVGIDLSAYAHNLLTLSFIMIAGALAWNWMGGFVGQVSFGHAAMFGVGGFVTGRLMLSAHLPAQAAWIGGALAAGVFALGAHPMLRLRGPYFSIATIGVGEASRLVFTYWEWFTGGSSGLSLPIDADAKYRLYWWALALAAATAAASYVIRRSSLGLKLLAIKADVDAAADVGVSATFYQDLIFAVSGAVVGLSGGLYASYFSFIEPGDMFGFDRSITFVLMAVIGGVGTSLGPVLGAVVFVLVRTYLLASYPDAYLGMYGLLLVLIILFEPLGLTGLGRRVHRAVHPVIRSASRRARPAPPGSSSP